MYSVITLQLSLTPIGCGLLTTHTLAQLSHYFAEGCIKLFSDIQ